MKMIDMKKTVAAHLLERLPMALQAQARLSWSHTYSDLTGIDEVIALMGGLNPPALIWERVSRGADTLVSPKIRYCSGDYTPPLLRAANEMVADLVPLRAARYRLGTLGGAQRESADRAAAERALAAVMPVWCRMALQALMTTMAGELWEISYRWAQPYAPRISTSIQDDGRDRIYPQGIDPQMPHISGRPITAAAVAIARRAVEETDLYIRLYIRGPVLALTADSVESYVQRRSSGFGGRYDAVHAVNRSGYLPEIAGIELSRFSPPGIYARIEADPEIEAHRARLQQELRSRSLTLA